MCPIPNLDEAPMCLRESQFKEWLSHRDAEPQRDVQTKTTGHTLIALQRSMDLAGCHRLEIDLLENRDLPWRLSQQPGRYLDSRIRAS